MDGMNFFAIGVAAVAVLILSTVWYSVFTKQMAELNPAYADPSSAKPPPGKVAVELLRNLVLASVVAGLSDRIDVEDWTGGLALGFALWVGFPVVLWTGAIMWEKVPPKLAVIHAGDWLLKLLVITIIVGVWR